MIRVWHLLMVILLSLKNPLFQEAGENMVQFVDQFGWLHRLCLRMLCILADDAGLEMAGEKFDSQRIERGTDGRNLIQDINAIAVVFDHPLDSSDLAGDSIGPAPDTFAGTLQHGNTYTRYTYIASGGGIFPTGAEYSSLRHRGPSIF
jgi:hypothetical protein